MDERRSQIVDDLRGLIAGDLIFDPIGRAPYALDASLYEIQPLGVVAPRTEADLIAVVKYTAENALPLHARGAGTGLAGEGLGPGLVIDFSRHLRRIVEMRSDSVVVQPGIVLDDLNAHLAPLGRRLGPDPGGSEACTVGGMIGGDAAGARSLKYGTTADAVERLKVVFAHGELGEMSRFPWPPTEFFGDPEAEPFANRLGRKVGTLLHYHAESIARKWPRSPRNRAGYALLAAMKPGEIDLARLIVGSEGTLALVTEATLRTVPLPSAQAVVLLPFGRLRDASDAVMECLEDAPSALELHDWRTLSLARDAAPEYRAWIVEEAEAALVVEFEGNDARSVERRARSLADRLSRRGGLVGDPVETSKRSDCELILALRRNIQPHLMRQKGPLKPVPLVEDVAVPPESLSEFLMKLQNLWKEFGVTGTVAAHAGQGQVHARPFLDPTDPSLADKIEPLASAVYELALSHGGTISGEHGCGLVRTQFLRRQYGELAGIFREVKNAFDPLNLLNPGKIVGDDPHLMTKDLRTWPKPAEITEIELPVLLRWPDMSREENATACNGCGTCRSGDPSLRMCPTFRASRDEAATPRAHANLLRQVASGALDPRLWGSEEMKRNADLCIHCNMCRVECPAGVDVSGLMLEAKAAYVANHGIAPEDWMLSRIDIWSRWASRLPVLFNLVMNKRSTRWLLERAFGLARLRKLPKAHRFSFLHRAERLGLTKPRPHAPGPRVAYFVDVVADHFDQELAETVVTVLRHAGVNVYVPKSQRGSGMPALVAGDLDRARDLLHANLRVLGNAVRDGYTIVCSEPTAMLMLKQESLRLTDNLDAILVAKNTMDVGQYFAGLIARGQVRPPEFPIRARVGYHQPCHLRALGIGTPGLDLIRSIPELDVEFIDRGCSGMAGTYGLASKNFRASLRAGRGLRDRLRDDDLDLGSTECSACQMQMEQNLDKKTLHPIKLLSLGYGLNPSLRKKLRGPDSKDR